MKDLKIFKDNTRITVKLFIMVWVVLLVHVLLKVTFNYWQPYVIPNEQLQYISNFIDNHRWLQATLNGIFYVFNGVVMILSGLQIWWFKNKKTSIIVLILLILVFLSSVLIAQSSIITLCISLGLPLIINYRKWLTILLSFVFSNIFLFFSLWLEGFTNSNDMPYIIGTFLNIDYYIMLVLNYFAFNLIRKKESKNG